MSGLADASAETCSLQCRRHADVHLDGQMGLVPGQRTGWRPPSTA